MLTKAQVEQVITSGLQTCCDYYTSSVQESVNNKKLATHTVRVIIRLLESAVKARGKWREKRETGDIKAFLASFDMPLQYGFTFDDQPITKLELVEAMQLSA